MAKEKVDSFTKIPEYLFKTSCGCETVTKPRDNWAPGLGGSTSSQCQSCMYYINKRCRRNAPRGQDGWSAVYPTDWCGQHKLSKDKM
jgi:hypothetical protein